MNALRALLIRNPAKVVAFGAALINLAVSFGAHLTGDNVAQLNTVLLLLVGLIADTATTPTAAPVLPVNTDVNAGAAVVASKVPPPEPTASVDPPAGT